jgi:signal transduction histidine kinase
MEYSKQIKVRIRILLLASSIAVALVFGLSFYFSLVSAESALASTVPELAELAERFKSTLILNTLVFVGILIGSFVVLGSLVTDRLFKPLESVEKGLMTVASGTLPSEQKDAGCGPFETICDAFTAARSRLEAREKAEISALEKCVSEIAEGIDVTDRLGKLIEAKKNYTGLQEIQTESGSANSTDDQIFMQSV